MSAVAVPARRSALPARATAYAGTLALGAIVAGSGVLAVGTAGRARWAYVPATVHGAFTGWLAGPLHGLHVAIAPRGGAYLLFLLLAAYAVVLACAEALPLRRVAVAVVVAHVAFLLAPPLFSTDVFGYVAYARLDAVHGFDPYVFGAGMAPHDPVFPFIAWHGLTTPYGPLFTLASLPLGLVSVPVALWTMKAIAMLLSLGVVALVWQIARRRDAGISPAAAVAFVGLNPIVLAYAVGGAHNDVLLMAFVLAAVLFALQRREAASGVAAVLALGAKASAAIVLPFLWLGTARGRRRPLAIGAVAAAVAAFLASLFAFGLHSVDLLVQIRTQQDFVAPYAVPQKVGELLGFAHAPWGLRLVFMVGLVASVLGLMWATWRERIEWTAAAGWATLALLLSTAWLLPWYVLWLLPLAAVARDRRLRLAALLFCAFVLWTNLQRLVV